MQDYEWIKIPSGWMKWLTEFGIVLQGKDSLHRLQWPGSSDG